VILDNETGVSTALRRLAEAGHRTIAVLSPTRRFEIERPAEEIAQRVAADLGLELRLLQCPHDLAGATEVAYVSVGDAPYLVGRALTFGAPRLVGIVTPLGGLVLIAGWILFAVTVLRP